MSFADAVRTCFSKYADFSGRARRSEYWYFVLATGLVLVLLDPSMLRLGRRLVSAPQRR